MQSFQPGQLKGKTAFIAGGTSGINLAIAERYAEHGAKLAVLGRNPERAEAAAEQLRAHGGEVLALTCDVRDHDAVAARLDEVVAAFGPLDVVVSGAAGNFLAPAAAMSANAFAAVVNIDLLGTFNVYRASFEHLRKPGASLISITAGQAHIPMPMQAHACAAKAGVNMLTRCLALEWGEVGVRVNALSPGPIEGTEGVERLIPTPELRAAMVKQIPLGRYGTGADIGDVALFLASDAARYITGAILPCDGGSELGDASRMRQMMAAAGNKPGKQG